MEGEKENEKKKKKKKRFKKKTKKKKKKGEIIFNNLSGSPYSPPAVIIILPRNANKIFQHKVKSYLSFAEHIIPKMKY